MGSRLDSPCGRCLGDCRSTVDRGHRRQRPDQDSWPRFTDVFKDGGALGTDEDRQMRPAQDPDPAEGSCNEQGIAGRSSNHFFSFGSESLVVHGTH